MITYDQLIAPIVQTDKPLTLKEFDVLVERAKSLKENLKTNRMAIAELAIRACFIQHGGDTKTKKTQSQFKGFRLKDFCRRTKLNVSTVSRWIVMKKEVWDFLSIEQKKNFIFSAGDYAARQIRKKEITTKEERCEMYERYTSKKEGVSSFRIKRDAISYLSRGAYLILKKEAIYQFDEDELLKVRETCKALLTRVANIKKVKKIGVKNDRIPNAKSCNEKKRRAVIYSV